MNTPEAVNRGRDQVHAQVHHRGQGLHQDGGDAYTKHGADDGAVRAEAPEGEAHDGAAPHHTQPHHHAHHLAQHSGQRGAGHLHPGEGADAEDEEGVQNQIDDRADALDDHRAHSVAGCLKGALSGKLHADADGGPSDDGEILDAVVDHLGLPGGEEPHKDGGQAHPQDQKDHPADQIDEVAVGHYPVGLVGPALPQPAGQQGVEAHAGAYAHGDHQGLDRVDKRQGYKPVGAELGHEHAVHQIIEGLDQHGQHHGPGHVQQQPAHRHDCHLVFLQNNSS